MYRGPLIMYSFNYIHSTCKYFIEIKSQIYDLCLSVRNDEKRSCNKFLFAIFLETVISDETSNTIKRSEQSKFHVFQLVDYPSQFSQFSLWDEKARIEKIAMGGQPICEKHESVPLHYYQINYAEGIITGQTHLGY